MNKEAYVSFEVAKLLKEKGFNWECTHYYDDDGTMHKALDYVRQNDEDEDDNDECLCPTQQKAMRWLREIKNIDIEPFVYCNHHDGSKAYGCNIQENGHLLMTDSFVQDTYEEAVDAALKYCLTELI